MDTLTVNERRRAAADRLRWSVEGVEVLFELPFNDLIHRAHQVHRRHFDPNAVQLSTLLSVKTGGCPEDCAYCPQAARYRTGVANEDMLSLDEVLAAARLAKEHGATRFCMGAAWRGPKARDLERVAEMVTAVRGLGLETCATLGLLKEGQAEQLRAAGLDYYNHNLDTSPEFYGEIVTTRTQEDRLETLERVRRAGIRVCCGGIIGMGETRRTRAALIAQLASLDPYPESVPINNLVQVAGTPLHGTPPLDPLEFVRTIACARITMPRAMVRLSAGRQEMSDGIQALCFFAGANSIFYGEKLLTTGNPDVEQDRALFARLGLRPMPLDCEQRTVNGDQRMAMPFSALATELAQLEDQGLRRRRRVLESPQGARVTVDGREYVAFCSNDYLGLASHRALIEAARDGAARHGVGAGASHLVLGHCAAHHALEEALAAFVGMPRALLFSTGYLANIGAVTALVGRDDAVFADRLNHASLNDAALLSRADFKRYPHLDLAALERALAASHARRKLIVTDAVFSMEGDIVPVPDLIALAERYGAWLLLDDAHGFGVLGCEGRGVLAHFNARSPRVIYMATLGKAAGVFGAFVAGGAELVETLVQRARAYVYTTAAPPLLSVALMKSLDLIRDDEWRRDRLRNLVRRLRAHLEPRRWQLMPSQTAIQPLVIGSNDEAVAVSENLARDGLLVPAIRPPTVPHGTARLRISLSAAHSFEDVEQLAAALKEIERAVPCSKF